MGLRKSSLPPGWYPESQNGISRFLAGSDKIADIGGPARAAVAPHAGWFYSGRTAARAVSLLDKRTETLAIIGGHLPAGRAPLFAMEDGAETPLGPVHFDSDLRAAMIEGTGGREDRHRDNTVEVLLPMARFFLPNASVLWMRLPAEASSFAAGEALAAAAEGLGRRVSVLASADLTHYGPRYGFAPKGAGEAAVEWVRATNDRRLIDAVLSGDPAAVLDRAEKESSSCSAGAILAAMGFAKALGTGGARLLEYATSADGGGAADRENFVGYAAIGF